MTINRPIWSHWSQQMYIAVLHDVGLQQHLATSQFCFQTWYKESGQSPRGILVFLFRPFKDARNKVFGNPPPPCSIFTPQQHQGMIRILNTFSNDSTHTFVYKAMLQ